MALTRDAIVDAAEAILDEYGLADLSMRRVADLLGVQAGALYYHLPNKQTLLAAVADGILGAMGQADTLQGWATEYRRLLLGRRDAAELVASTRAMGLGEVDPTAPARGLVPTERAGDVLATFEHFVLGATLHDQTQAQLGALGVVRGFDEAAAEATFQEGLRILSRGVGIFTT
ncbi:MAG: TetR family transcriptional regulator [Propionibacterium sp.]|nr:TetR family transcriptional regulator [Propionibacterium sp.]